MENEEKALAEGTSTENTSNAPIPEPEQKAEAKPVDRMNALEAKVAELEAKIAKLDEFLAPHGHNRVIPEVIEPQCQSEIAEPQTE
jgi:hypothetical protein